MGASSAPIPTPSATSTASEKKSFRAGLLGMYVNEWRNAGAPDAVLDIISGYKLPFVRQPPLLAANALPCNLSTPISPEMDEVIAELVLSGAARIVTTPSPSFLSPFFLVDKPDGSKRSIFNLSHLNEYLDPVHFQLPNIREIREFLQPGDFLCSVDLTNSYYQIPMHENFFKFLRFLYRGTLYEMMVLPQGLSTAPRTFTIVAAWLTSRLRSIDIQAINYLDDWLFRHSVRSLLADQMIYVVNWYHSLGIQVSVKSELIPEQVIQFIGVIFNPRLNYCALPIKKQDCIRNIVRTFLDAKVWSRKQLERFCGKIAFASQVLPLGRLFSRLLQMHLNVLSRSDPHLLLPVPHHLFSDLVWWATHVVDHDQLFTVSPSHFCVADASNYGCAAVIDGASFHTVWRDYQVEWHINMKELFAITHFMSKMVHALANSVVQIQTDNATTQSYLAKQGGTKSLSLYLRTRKFLLLLHKHRIQISVVRIPSVYNCLADALSRGQSPPEWHLLPRGVAQVTEWTGPPSLDLFASASAHVCSRYVTLDSLDLAAEWTNAFTRPWFGLNIWIFPPPFEIPRVLSHLRTRARGTFILLTPEWENAFWMVDLLLLSAQSPLRLRNLSSVLLDTRTGRAPDGINKIQILAWKLCF